VEKAKEATEGATFARNEYEKWHDANKTARKDLEHTLARHEKDREGLADERKLIRMIMRLIGKRVCTACVFCTPAAHSPAPASTLLGGKTEAMRTDCRRWARRVPLFVLAKGAAVAYLHKR